MPDTMPSPIVYAEYEPTAAVGQYVAGYWTFAIDADAAIRRPLGIPPDGCLSLFWRLGRGKLYVAGAHTHRRDVPAHRGDRSFGVRFWPGAAQALLPLAPASIRERVLPASSIPGMEKFDGLTHALDRTTDPGEAAAVADRHLAILCSRARLPDPAVMQAAARIIQTAGECRLSELATRAALSPRQLRRRFLMLAGLPPQAFMRIWRWRCCAASVAAESAINWAALATAYGYADQAHLVRAFRDAIGFTPKHYRRLVSRVDDSSPMPAHALSPVQLFHPAARSGSRRSADPDPV